MFVQNTVFLPYKTQSDYKNALNGNTNLNNNYRQALPVYKSLKITFKGSEKKPNQIAIMAAECIPYCEAGGLGAVTRDMLKCYKETYPNKDLRLFLPFYNAGKNGIPKVKGNFVYKIPEQDYKFYDLQDTGLQADFQYGIKKSTARLFKAKNPENNVPVYFTYFPEISDMKKPYSLDYFSMYSRYAAFCIATMKLMEKMHNSNENFNPKILHTKDWHTTIANVINNDKELKKIHELSNADEGVQGRIIPLGALLAAFDDNQIKKAINDKSFKSALYRLASDNKDILLKNINVNNLNNDIDNETTIRKILTNLADNYDTVLYKRGKNAHTRNKLNYSIIRLFPEINWDETSDFNPTLLAINKSDAWFTTSYTHFRELVTDPRFSYPSSYNMLRLNLNKGCGILNKIDTSRYNPNNPEQVQYPYTIENYKVNKFLNKKFIFENFTKQNIKNKNIDKKLISHTQNAKIWGYLDKKYLKSPLVIDISRFDAKQKGCDIALKAVEQVLKENKNSAFIFAFPQISNFYPQEKLASFVKEVVNKPENRGRFILIDSYVSVNQYMAAADFFVIPSRSETCGLTGYQAMRMGAVPISTPVGSMNDKLITPEQDNTKAMGFKTPLHFYKCNKPELVLANTIEKALMIYDNEPELIDRMIKNSMTFNSDWSTAISEQKDLYEKVTNNEKINNLTLNDIRNIEDIVNIQMYNQNDIDKLQKADVLVVLPHSDDEIFFLPMLEYLQDGKTVQIVYSSANDKGHHRAGAPSVPEDLSKLREIEALESLSALGVKLNPIKLNIPDNDIPAGNNPQIISDYLGRILDKVKPQIVLSFGPDGTTGHSDHKKLGEIVFNSVKEYRQQSNQPVKVYQMAFAQGNVQKLKDIMSKINSDSFDFVEGVPEEKIVKTVDVTKYLDKIKKSLAQHKSQWSKDEAEGLYKYYSENGAAYTELKDFPHIDNSVQPWKYRNEIFSKTYGQEFQKNGNTLIFTPIGSKKSLSIKFPGTPASYGHLILKASDIGLNNIDISPDIPVLMLEQIAKIVKIPQFSNVKYINLVLNNNKRTNRISILEIPMSETKTISEYINEIYKNKEAGLKSYKKEYPLSKVKIIEKEIKNKRTV